MLNRCYRCFFFSHERHIMIDLTRAEYFILTVLSLPQVSGRAQASAKCWDTQTDAGALQLRGPTGAWPVDRICRHSPRQLRFPGTPEGKTTTRPTYLKAPHCKVCSKRFNTRSLITFLSVRRHRPEYKKRMRYQSQSTQTHKTPEGTLSFYCTVLLS